MNNLKLNDGGDVNTTTETKNESTENGCENITNVKNWARKCPKCNTFIYFSSKGNCDASEKGKCLCRSCSNFLNRWNKSELPEPKICRVCGVSIHHKRMFCSKNCFDTFQRKLIPKICFQCQNKFNSKNGVGKFCSVKCKNDCRNGRFVKICPICKNSFFSYDQKYCSLKCRDDSQRKELPIKHCKFCDMPFQNKQKKVKFCSHLCSVIHYLRFNDRVSKPEKELRKILSDIGIDFVPSFPIKNKVFDIYIPSQNLLIEVDGIYWHSRNKTNLNTAQLKNVENDNIKNGLAKEMGYNLLRVWEDDIKNVPEYLRK